MKLLDRARFQARRALPGASRRTPTVEWQANGVCNYDCSCTVPANRGMIEGVSRREERGD